jgi:hypothetical protein
MGFNIHLTISGLCAFVPREEIHFDGPEEPTISGMHVLVLEAREETQVDSREVCSHFPRLRFDRPQGPDGIWNLDGERLEIFDTAAPVPSGVTVRSKFAAVARMSVAAPGSEVVRQDVLTDTPPSDLIVGSLDLSNGFVDGDELSPQEWDFRVEEDAPGHGQGRFAGSVTVDLPIVGQHAVLRSKGFTGELQRQTVLRPKPGRQHVEVALSNLCAPGAHHEQREVEVDFAIFYRLSQDYDGAIFMPFRSRGPARPVGSEGEMQAERRSNPACIPAQFAPRS